MLPMFFLICSCAIGHVASQVDDVQNFTCEALRTVYQINNCCTQGCTAPPIMTNENRKWNIKIKDILEHRSGMLSFGPIEYTKYLGTILTGYELWEVQPLFDMMLEAVKNQWPNLTYHLFDYDNRYTVTQAILNKPLYGLFWPPGGPVWANDDCDLVVAAIGVAAKRLGFPNINSGVEYVQQKILAPLESSVWFYKGQLAAPSDVDDRMAELMVGRAVTLPPEYELYTLPRDPNHVYIHGEYLWASDVPRDGFVMSDRAYYVKNKTNSTDDYLAGAHDFGVAGTLQDFADLIKLCMRAGMHRRKDGTLVKVLSPEAINYAFRPWNGPFYPGEKPAGLWISQYSPSIIFSNTRFNGWGFSDDEADPFLLDHDRLKRGRYVNIGMYGTGFCFDMESGEYSIQASTQQSLLLQGAFFLRNDCVALGANQTRAQQLVDEYNSRPAVVMLVGKMDDYEIFVYKNEMRKGEQSTRNNLYYRWGHLSMLLSRLAIAAAFVDDRFMYDDELLSKYIPEFGNLEAFTPGPEFGLCEPGVVCRQRCLPSSYPLCHLDQSNAEEAATMDVNRRRRSN